LICSDTCEGDCGAQRAYGGAVEVFTKRCRCRVTRFVALIGCRFIQLCPKACLPVPIDTAPVLISELVWLSAVFGNYCPNIMVVLNARSRLVREVEL
jgi:hypothetical protein